MMLQPRRSSATAWVLFGTALLLGGCRTYGGYDSERATYAQILQANQRFEEDLIRARAEFAALESAPEPFMQAVAARYGLIVEAHEAVLDEHRQLAERLSEGSSHRALRRVYGAIVVEQRVLRSQYRELLEYVYNAFPVDTTAQSSTDPPYALIPPYYARISPSNRDMTVSDLLRYVRSRPAPAPGVQLLPPEEDENGAEAAQEHGAESGQHGREDPADRTNPSD